MTVADITNPFFTDVVSVIQEVLHRAGYAVMLCSNDEDIDTQDEQIQLLLDRMVDGLIISPAGTMAKSEAGSRSTTIRWVLIDRVCDGVETDADRPRQSAGRAGRHQLHVRLGHRRIGYISGSLHTSTGRVPSGRLPWRAGCGGFVRDELFARQFSRGDPTGGDAVVDAADPDRDVPPQTISWSSAS